MECAALFLVRIRDRVSPRAGFPSGSGAGTNTDPHCLVVAGESLRQGINDRQRHAGVDRGITEFGVGDSGGPDLAGNSPVGKTRQGYGKRGDIVKPGQLGRGMVVGIVE